jgi:hypothetical protein
MMHLIRSLAVAAVTVGLIGSASAEILAFATRTLPISGSSTTEHPLVLKDDQVTTVLPFRTTTKNQLVTITYNAECTVIAAPGTVFSIRIFVDGDQAEPASTNAFHPFCNAIDDTGFLFDGHSTGAVRQAVIRVPTAGKHVVSVLASLQNGLQGEYRIDDASLVVEGSPLAAATRSGGFSGTSMSEIALPLKDNGAKALAFQTTRKNARVRITFNAVCRVIAPRGTWVSVRILVDGNEADPASGVDCALCTAVSASTRTTETGVLRQAVIRVPEPGKHVVRVLARLASSAPATGLWFLDRTSLVVEDEILASTTRRENFFTGGTSEIQLPLRDDGATALRFQTTKNDQLVKMTYNAECGVFGAARGRAVSVRITVDHVEAQPASGSDFRMCTAVDETGNTWVAATRQSLIRVANAGKHVVRVFGRLLTGAGAWSLDDTSLVVE